MEFEFGKNATVESLDKVPEQFRGLYSQGEGGFVLGETFKGAASAVDGLNAALRRARKDAEDAKKNRPDMSAFQPLAQMLEVEEATPDALKMAIEGLLDKVSKGDQGKVNWEKMKQGLEKAHSDALKAKDGELGAMHSTLVKHLVTGEAVRAIATHKGVPDLLLPHIAARTKVIKDGNEFVVRVVDEAGDPRGNASGGFMTVEDLVKELKAHPTFGRAFESEAPSGSGTRPGSTTGKPPAQSQSLSPVDRIAAGLRARQRR
jgi:hypothetical protein